MSFRSVNFRFLAPAAQSFMIFGIISLCQPWSLLLHQYGVTMTLLGLVAFMVTSKIAPDVDPEEDIVDDDAHMRELFGDKLQGQNARETNKDGGIV